MLDIISSVTASTLRSWRGTRSVVRESQPEKILVLYDMEGCPYCRPVREVMTELGLDVIIKPCPKGTPGFWSEVEALTGKHQVPVLSDPNTGEVVSGSYSIIAYLNNAYTKDVATSEPSLPSVSRLASGVRFAKGIRGRDSNPPKMLLELYSFESSPYSRLVRETLTELGIAYVLRNCGKQQLSDQGVPWLRPTFKKYVPVPGSNRAKLLEKAGKVQVPYLYDPNNDRGLFESKMIVSYLNNQYGAK